MRKSNENFTELFDVANAFTAIVGSSASTIGYTPEDVVNKDNSSALGVSTTKYPSQQAVKTYVDARLSKAGGTMTGNLLFSTDNTLDIGAAGATRPRTIYVGTSVIAPGFTGALTGAASLNVLKAGDAMTGNLDMGGAKVTNLANTLAGGDGSDAVNKTYADSLVAGLLDDRGSFSAAGGSYPAAGGSGPSGAIRQGDIWYISVAGTLGARTVNVGDSVVALIDNAASGTDAHWNILESNIGFVPEQPANKSTDGTMVANSDTLFPTEQAVKTYIVANAASVSGEVTNMDGWSIEFFDEYPLGALSAPDKGGGWGATGVITGGTIVDRTVAGGTERRLSLAPNGEYGRQLSWGSDWLSLQICIMVRVNHTATFAADWALGICSGTVNMVRSNTCVNWIGNCSLPGNFNNMTIAALARGGNGFRSTQNRNKHKEDANWDVGGTGESGSCGRAFPSEEGTRLIRHISLTRDIAATAATVVTYRVVATACEDSTTENRNFTKRQMISMMEDKVLFSHATSGNNSTYSTSETRGAYDTFNFWWGPNVASKSIELAAIAVRKLS